MFLITESSQDLPDITHSNVLPHKPFEQIGHLRPKIHEKPDKAARFCKIERFG